jgi:DNA-binding HxlR family transcriptional regulator
MSSLWEEIIWDKSTITILKIAKNKITRFTEFIKGGVPRTTLDRRLKQLGSKKIIISSATMPSPVEFLYTISFKNGINEGV